jgi:hypothetical protein
MTASVRKIQSIFFIWVLILCGALIPPDKVTTINRGEVFKEIENAIGLGNASLLATLMGSSIELEIPGSEGIFSRSQAEQVLNKFFNKYPPTAFDITHMGHSAAGTRFAVGDYITSKDQTFRVTIFLKKTGGQYLIQEIKFE